MLNGVSSQFNTENFESLSPGVFIFFLNSHSKTTLFLRYVFSVSLMCLELLHLDIFEKQSTLPL